MKEDCYELWRPVEYHYAMSYGFIPNLHGYLHEDDCTARPCILIAPGGGYCLVSSTEAELVALKFYHKGYHAFVLTYTTNLLMRVPLNRQPMMDLSRAIRFLRKNASEFHIQPDKIVLCGFSAGGHLCASLCVHYADITDSSAEYAGISNRPNAAVLSYPVITSGEKAHRDSFVALLGSDAALEDLDYMSLEKHVEKNTPPCFLWHTATDELVPVENSILFAEACRKQRVPFALHIFSDGSHGLSLADQDWASGKFGKAYTNAQMLKIIGKMQNGELAVPPGKKVELLRIGEGVWRKNKPNGEVAVWPELADQWIKTILPK